MTFDEVRDRAEQVRSTPLEAVLHLMGAEQDEHDKAKWHTEQGTISVTGTKFMNWNQAHGGGGAIDLVIHLQHLGFKSAVQWLWDHFPSPGSAKRPVPCQMLELQLPARDDRKLSAVRHYLVRDRGLAPFLLEPFIQSGTLYADTRGNAVFLLLGKGNNPVGAELRGTTHRPWRGMAPGSQKDLGYFSAPASDTAAIILCESAIDAISCSALHPHYLCISTSGARSNPRWLRPLVHQGHQIYCGFDSDPIGENMAHTMIAVHPGVQRLRPTHHDWNDVLKSLP